jgi:Matrixin
LWDFCVMVKNIKSKVFILIGVQLMFAFPLSSYTYNNLGDAGGWDNVNKGSSVSWVSDRSDYTKDLTDLQVNLALSNAFSTWDNVQGANSLSFQRKSDLGGNYDVYDGNGGQLDQGADARYANVTIGGFLSWDYFESLISGGGDSILGVAFTQKLRGGGAPKPFWNADIYFNDWFDWSTSPTSGQIDLETVATHEVGHALGLGHSDVNSAVMYSYYGGINRVLQQDDIDGITSLYSDTKESGNKGRGGKGKPSRLLDAYVNGDWRLSGVTYLERDLYESLPVVSNPEPTTYLLLGAFLTLVLLSRRWKRRFFNQTR